MTFLLALTASTDNPTELEDQYRFLDRSSERWERVRHLFKRSQGLSFDLLLCTAGVRLGMRAEDYTSAHLGIFRGNARRRKSRLPPLTTAAVEQRFQHNPHPAQLNPPKPKTCSLRRERCQYFFRFVVGGVETGSENVVRVMVGVRGTTIALSSSTSCFQFRLGCGYQVS